MSEQDCLRRFVFEDFAVRGEWVRLQTSWQQTKQHQALTPELESQLGQALAAVVLLSATIKFEGAIILQAQGDGGLKTLVAQSSHARKIRGLVRADVQQCGGSLTDMLGNGQLVLTVDTKNKQSYQGVVSLEGDCLAQLLETYFRQSEQLQTRLWLFANGTQAVGLLLQELPVQDDYQVDWERIEVLASTITAAELFDLDCEQILYRLFHQEKIRLFAPETVEFCCSCSREKISQTLYAMGQADLLELLAARQVIDVSCEFCLAHYFFHHQDITDLFLAEKHD